MGVRGTENYIYYTEKLLGSGSTGVVYFGRHKRKGDACAVKIFSQIPSRSVGICVTKNELDFMRRLRHRNIVSLLAIEKDLKSNDTALIMEFCSFGSLHKLLHEPENYYGIPETQFLNFLYQFCDGLAYLRVHGVTHRDIKPANILCTKTEYGSMWYKITDFGASKELLTENSSKSIFGTEEYLHPDIYKCILLDKKMVRTELELRSELWSIGVTLYQVATGKLPFTVPGGRKNKAKMYEMLSRKSKGDINGTMKENSNDVEYSKSFPKTCSLSEGLAYPLLEILGGLMENNHLVQFQFEQLFPMVEDLKSLKLLLVFDVFSSVIHKVYFKQYSKFSDFKEEVFRLTKIKEKDQVYIVSRRKLEADDNDLIYQTNPEIRNQIILLLPLAPKFPSVKHAFIPSIPKFQSDKSLQDDYVWCSNAAGWCSKLFDHIENLTKKQILVSDLKEKLHSILLLLSKKVNLISEVHKTREEKKFVGEILELAKKFEKKFRNVLQNPVLSTCFIDKCSTKAQNINKFANEVRQEFGQDKKKVLNHNEEQIHKYKKVKLEEKLKEVQSLYQNHCEKETEVMIKAFEQWYRSNGMEPLRIYQEIECILSNTFKTNSENNLISMRQNENIIQHIEKLLVVRGSLIEGIVLLGETNQYTAS